MHATLNCVVSTIRLPLVNVGDFSVAHIALGHLVLQLLLIGINYIELAVVSTPWTGLCLFIVG